MNKRRYEFRAAWPAPGTGAEVENEPSSVPRVPELRPAELCGDHLHGRATLPARGTDEKRQLGWFEELPLVRVGDVRWP